ncbi:MAG TPA: hypothetical protein VKF82_01195 [Candidatus Eremiobacteraceae bacterium]|nr:hypothetical protein [Candidatus Eremiobacteraceae bacterium]
MAIAAPASAAGHAVGDQFVYTLKNVTQAPIPDNMPAYMRGQYESQRALANSMVTTLTLHVDALNPDGSAHATGTAEVTMPPGTSPMLVKTMASQPKDLTATIMADGAIVPKYEAPDVDPTTMATMSHAQQVAMANQSNANYAGGLVKGHVGDFNEFALGCSKRSSFKAGDAWRLVDGSTTWTFAVTGTDQVAGHNVVVVTMSTSSLTSNMTSKQNATGDYDPAQHIVVRFHEESQQTNSAMPGTTTNTEDIALQ